eukprot:TRINITY_DN1236_c0_g1_i1.p1 TRINITY_DN1236_c0_g1~~TRINITY_DN1236_c0_g1_i1.p1  ORF type:complete len:248 (-),score=32.97 TRINITY_DN1236_c0_g1_i1:38-781(-)
MKRWICVITFVLWIQCSISSKECVDSGTKYNSTVFEIFGSKIRLNATSFSCNAYSDSSCSPEVFPGPPVDNENFKDMFCAVKYSSDQRKYYVLVNYPSVEKAKEDRAFVTHKTACGTCSSLQDLSVYMKYEDLTSPVRKCALEGFISQHLAMNCLMDIGFSKPCALVWLANTQCTSHKCRGICLWDIFEPYNDPQNNCKLNDCLQCDEDSCGPMFKRFSGRTRRNSGLYSAIWRPPNTIYNITHDYY